MDIIIGIIFFGVIGFFGLALVFLAIDYIGSKEIEPVQGTVVSLNHVPSDTHIGVGPAIGGNGGVATTVSTSSEKWVVVVEIGSSKEAITTRKKIWSQIEIGDTVIISRRKGYFGDISLEDIVDIHHK